MAIIVLQSSDVLELQRKTIDLHGGVHGIRDENAFESAIAAVENRIYYEGADVIVSAATYAYHLCQAHAFLDGNKRVAAAAMLVFLTVNGYILDMEDTEIIQMFLDIAAGKLDRDMIERILKNVVKL